jgi:hypothetical protein
MAMPLDPEIREANRGATARIRDLAARLSDEDLRRPVGEHWTVAITLVHLSFWDRRVIDVLDRSERAGAVEAPEIDIVVNDLSLASWAAIPPHAAVRLAVEAAESLDDRLDAVPDWLVAEILAGHPRWVRRHLHRTEHLDEAEAGLRFS